MKATRAGCPAALTQPGNRFVDLGVGQVGFDIEAAFPVVHADAAGELHRHRSGERRADIEANRVRAASSSVAVSLTSASIRP